MVDSLPLAAGYSIHLSLILDQSSITFDSKMRQSILFEDRGFSNSKKYFWALQSLRLFAEHVDGTLRSIPNCFVSTRLSDFSLDDYDDMKRMMEEQQQLFRDLQDRIERKRQEIQSLRDGVCPLSKSISPDSRKS